MSLFSIFKRVEHPEPAPVRRPDYSYLEDDGPKMKKLYSRAVEAMEERRLYLDGDLCLEDLARKLYCNKVYLSKTINRCSGKNFRALVNGYRIRYAAELMKKDPRMKIEEVSRMSGFNSLPSFNSSFKLIMKERPSEYLATVRENLRKSR